MTEYISRSVPTEVRIKPGDGRVVEAYAAVFDVEAEIRDHQGHYREVIDRGAFNRVIGHVKPQGKREYWSTKVFYNHGLTLHGTPSETGSVPVARTEHIEADSTGLLTVSRYLDDPFSDKILNAIREGAITAQSFTGRIVRSNPDLRPGGRHKPSAGTLPVVRRTELGLTEYGPTPVPAYADAEIVGVRSISELLGYDLNALRTLLAATPDIGDVVDPETTGTDPHGSPAADDPPQTGHSTRPEDQYQRRLQAALRARGITTDHGNLAGNRSAAGSDPR